ncbi:hypothetical protein BGY98DRAFT_1095087 [Russula aff. rugulosa BPL654]|nr:hypothetical protein BGY98DRAFT_1095087 [Russula aff. rugulosa BPL654]
MPNMRLDNFFVLSVAPATSPVTVQAMRPLQSSNSFLLMSLLLRQSQLLGLQTFQNLPILKLRSVSMGDKGTECPDDNFPQRHSKVPTGDTSDLPPLKLAEAS